MDALVIARRRLLEHLQRTSGRAPVRVATDLLGTGRGHLLPVLSSALAQDILRRGYDGGTLDRIYENKPRGSLGPIGRMADRVVLDLPIHHALRERLEAAGGEMLAAAVLHLKRDPGNLRILSVPCGTGSEWVLFANRLREIDPSLLERVRCWGTDRSRNSLREAAARASRAGLSVEFLGPGASQQAEMARIAAEHGGFHLITAFGLTQQDGLQGIDSLLNEYAGYLASGGTLLFDRWEPGETTAVMKGLNIQVRHHPSREVYHALANAGLDLRREHPSGEGGCVLVVARKA
jgi:hypothetical protein